jgi:hypothetical protein
MLGGASLFWPSRTVGQKWARGKDDGKGNALKEERARWREGLSPWDDWGYTEMRAQRKWTTKRCAEATEVASYLTLNITARDQSLIT